MKDDRVGKWAAMLARDWCQVDGWRRALREMAPQLRTPEWFIATCGDLMPRRPPITVLTSPGPDKAWAWVDNWLAAINVDAVDHENVQQRPKTGAGATQYGAGGSFIV